MVRFILFLLMINLFCGIPISAQDEPVEWAPIGAKWWYSYSGFGLGQHYLTMESMKDTVVQDKNARILDIEAHYAEGFFLDTASTITYFENTDFPPRIILHQQGDSIFYLRKNKFELLYDFSMKAGDSMNVTVPQQSNRNSSQDSVLFINIDSEEMVNINGQKLAKQTRSLYRPPGVLTPGFGFLAGRTVIEKIGDLGFFLPFKDIECDAICPY